MKTGRIIVLAISLIGVALGVSFCLALKNHYSEVSKMKCIPSAELVTTTGDRFILDELGAVKKTALLFFSPECEYCRKEIEGIIENRSLFDGSVWVFVTMPPVEELWAFMAEYHLDAVSGSKICVDESLELYETFDVTAPPSIFIYDADGRLEHYNRGAVSIKTIIEWMK